MTFSFDNGKNHPETRVVSTACEDTQRITITTHEQSDRIYKSIEANILAHELPDLLAAYMEKETLALDALHLFDQHLWSELQDTFETHRAAIGGVRPRRTVSGTPKAQPALIGKTGTERKDQDDIWI